MGMALDQSALDLVAITSRAVAIDSTFIREVHGSNLVREAAPCGCLVGERGVNNLHTRKKDTQGLLESALLLC